MDFKPKSKVEREKMDFKNALFLLTMRIDRQVFELNGMNIEGLEKVKRGIHLLETRLHPYMNEDYEEEKKKLEDIIVTDEKTWKIAFKNILLKYGALHDLMDSENLLMTEMEESEA